MDDAIQEAVAGLSESMMQLSTLMAPLIDALQGYKKQLEVAGFDGYAVNMMACEYHSLLMNIVMKDLGA